MKTSKKHFGMSRIFTLVIALCMISTFSFASELQKMQSKSVKMVTSSNFVDFIHSLSDTYTEENLAIEDWMLNPDSFIDEAVKDVAFKNEESLEIENWMLDVQAFIPEENEPGLALEKWMMNVDSFMDHSDLSQNFAKK